jgi:hypothetical protein
MTPDQPGYMAHQVIGGIAAVFFLVVVVVVLWYGILAVVAIVGVVRQLWRPDGRAEARKDLAEFRKDLGELRQHRAQRKADGRDKRSRPAARVLEDRFHTWPQIYQGGTATQPLVTLKARYASPASVKTGRRLAAPAAVLLFVWMERVETVPVLGDDSLWWQVNFGRLFVCAALAFIAFYALRELLFPRLFWGRPLLMRFEDGGITWGSGPRWLKGLQFWRADPRGLVLPGEPRQAEKVPRHRKAQAELEANEQRRAQRLKPRRTFYQRASEVLIFAGPDFESWRPVAELADDPTAQWAHRLASAINAADELALSLLPKKAAATEAPRSALPLPVRRPEAPEPGGLLE